MTSSTCTSGIPLNEARGTLITFGETMGLFGASRLGRFGLERNFVLGIGGAESNVAIGAARLDATAAWFGRLGDDSTGSLIETILRNEGVETHVTRDNAFTGLMVKHERFAGSSHVDYHRAGSAGSRLSPDDIPEDAVRAASILHFTGITPALSESARAATYATIDTARAAGVTVSFDVNFRNKLWTSSTVDAAAVLRDLLNLSDIVFAGPDEAGLVLGTEFRSSREAAQGMRDAGVVEVVIKDGARGCFADDGQESHAVPAVNVPVVDPVGAGDAFVAGYLADRLAGRSLYARLRTAVQVGGLAVSVPGDCENLPRRRDLNSLGGVDVAR
ncbi:sugar kinase [Nocardioides astragali]|uniref:Sugar kinase n=1 Tax=Nocardioides astragali TaxID=1776736 RepID=A0ABW2N7M8_9ACTN|nr:sugar kinase [Nocardioides astragali]